MYSKFSRLMIAALVGFLCGTVPVLAQNINLSGTNYRFGSVGVGVAPTGTPGTLSILSTGGIQGTVAADSAAAGNVGEFLTTTVATASAVSLTTATAADVMTLSLTPGDWDASFQVRHKPAATTSVTILSCSLSPTLNTMGTQPGASGIGTDGVAILTTAANVLGGEFTQTSIPVRIQLAATTTIHVVCNDTFTVSTMAAYGTVSARRAR